MNSFRKKVQAATSLSGTSSTAAPVRGGGGGGTNTYSHSDRVVIEPKVELPGETRRHFLYERECELLATQILITGMRT